ncbi:MAG: DUF2079 domain-containing protein [Microcoleaceae cyanobacterium]
MKFSYDFKGQKQLSFNHPVAKMVGITTVILFLCSSLRHALFQSTAFELGIYDQVAYLISQGKPPISSFLEIHHMGNHAAWVMYPVALLYRIYPSVHWLFLIQSISLAIGAWPTWSLANHAGLGSRLSTSVALTYLLYPVIFNVNLFDFHPEVMALPAILGAILAARLDKIIWFYLAIIWVLGCKDALALTVVAMGIWLYFFDKKRPYGAIALLLGSAWFIIAVQGIIPYFKDGRGPGGVGRYSYLGSSISEILLNIFLKPELVTNRILSWETLEYLALLFLPVVLWLSPRCLSPLVAAFPALLKNVLSDIDAQRDLIHQYSIPIVPFLMVAVITSLSDEHDGCLGRWIIIRLQAWQKYCFSLNYFSLNDFFLKIKLDQLMILWAILGFLCLAKFGYFWSIYLEQIDTLQSSRTAISYITTQGNILTTANFAPHLTHRSVVEFTNKDAPPQDLALFDYVLLNLRHPGWKSDLEFAQSLAQQLKQLPDFQLSYQQDEVYLFTHKSLTQKSLIHNSCSTLEDFLC